MLGQRRRRWSDIEPTSGQYLMFPRIYGLNHTCHLEVPGSSPGRADICHRVCAYTALQAVPRHGVYSAVYDTVHYKEPLKSFEIRVGHSPGFGLRSVAILPQCAESNVKQYTYIYRRGYTWVKKRIQRTAKRLFEDCKMK